MLKFKSKNITPDGTSSPLWIWMGVISLALIWGSTWLAIKIGLEDASPFCSASPRFILAAGSLYIFLKLRGQNLPRQYQFWGRTIFIAMFMFIIPYGLVYWGEQHISSGLAAILFSTQSLFVVAFAHRLLLSERATFRKLAGLTMGLVGLFFVFYDQIGWEDNWGMAGMIGILMAAACGGFALVWLHRLGKSVNTLAELTAQLGVTALVFTIMGLLLENNSTDWTSLKLWISISYLALIGTAFAFSVYYWLAKHTTALITSFSIFASPVFAVFLGWLVLGETMGIDGLIGSSLVLFGVVLSQTRSNNKG